MKEQSTIKKYNKKGFSLAEIIISVGVIGIVVTGAVYAIVQASVIIITAKQKDTATSLMQEQFNSVISNAKNNWGFIAANTGISGSLPQNLSFTNIQIINGTTTANSSTIISGTGTQFTNDLTTGDTIALMTPSTITGNTTASAATQITGVGTLFNTQLVVGDYISLSGAPSIFAQVTAITSATSITISAQLGNGTTETIIKSNPGTSATVSTINSDTSITVSTSIGGGTTQNILRYKNAYIASSGNKNIFIAASTFSSGYTIDKSYRDVSGNLSILASDTIDLHYRLLTATTTWNDISGIARKVTTQSYISDYDSKKLSLSTFNDFRRATSFSSTYVTSSGPISLLNASPTTYLLSGTYTSQVFDTFSTGSNYYIAEVTLDLPTVGSTTLNPTGANAVVFQFQGANSVSTINTSPSFQNITCIKVPGYSQSAPTYNYQCDLSSITQKRYFQYLLTLNTVAGTNTQTPLIRAMVFYYQ